MPPAKPVPFYFGDEVSGLRFVPINESDREFTSAKYIARNRYILLHVSGCPPAQQILPSYHDLDLSEPKFHHVQPAFKLGHVYTHPKMGKSAPSTITRQSRVVASGIHLADEDNKVLQALA